MQFPAAQRKISPPAQTELFQNGQVVFHHPYKVFYSLQDAAPDAKKNAAFCRIVLSVPKRNFKKAVHRNRIKRQMREVFRLQQAPLLQALQQNHLQIAILCLYLPHEMLDTPAHSLKMGTLLERLVRRLTPSPEPALDSAD